MCFFGGGSKAEKPKQFQTAQEPLRRESSGKPNKRGRRGTALTAGSAIQSDSTSGKKTALGT
ncbi:MAG: hypothetical protein AAGE89_16435 [Pseudomonadota bacterium]